MAVRACAGVTGWHGDDSHHEVGAFRHERRRLGEQVLVAVTCTRFENHQQRLPRCRRIMDICHPASLVDHLPARPDGLRCRALGTSAVRSRIAYSWNPMPSTSTSSTEPSWGYVEPPTRHVSPPVASGATEPGWSWA